ncbi:MAG: hypothetical protein IJW17_03760 [Lentisphaeria bacterium]|nr:hypothetical protein [Lentisphaeria bacterium]
MTQTPTPVTADFCSFDEYKKIEGTKRTIGFCNNDVTAPSDFSDSGYVEIKETGIYTFLIESDDGATLNVSGNSVSDSTQQIDWDGHMLGGALYPLYKIFGMEFLGPAKRYGME